MAEVSSERVRRDGIAGGRSPGRARGATDALLSAVTLVGLTAAAALGLRPAEAGADLHAAVGLVAGGLAAAAHIRWGGGRDLLATLLVAVGVLLGMGVTGGLVTPGGHGGVALVAALFSMGVHGEHLWRRFRG